MNSKRAIEKRFGYPRMTEPMLPGRYEITIKTGDDAEQEKAWFEIHPGNTYQDMVDLCDGYCEGRGDFCIIRDIRREEPDGMLLEETKDVFSHGIVLEKDENDEMHQGNIYLTPDRISEVVSAAGKAVYGRKIKIS